MNKARLVKRTEVTKLNQGRPLKCAPQPSVERSSVEVVKEWVEYRKKLNRVSAREAFATLFVQPQTN